LPPGLSWSSLRFPYAGRDLFAFHNQLLQGRKQNVLSVRAEEYVVSVRCPRYQADPRENRQLSLHRPKRQLALARDFPHIHLAPRVMKQRAQDLSANHREK
jgi:hypothetical protein